MNHDESKSDKASMISAAVRRFTYNLLKGLHLSTIKINSIQEDGINLLSFAIAVEQFKSWKHGG